MPNSVRVQPRPDTLGNDVEEIVLKVLGDARHECRPDHQAKKLRYADEKGPMIGSELLWLRRIVADDVAEDRRVEQRECLVDCRERQRQKYEVPVGAQIAE